MPWRRHGITLGICILGMGVCWFLWNDYVDVTLTLVAESAPYLLIGFALAGLLKAVVPEDKVYKHLGDNRFKSVTLASLFGIPLPLCSCSVLPVATSLRRSGASKGATTSFLISTPETGLDSIGITYALLDPIMTVARPLGAFATAVFTGLGGQFSSYGAAGDGDAETSPAVPDNAAHDDGHDHGHDHSAVYTPGGIGGRSVREVTRDSVSYAFGAAAGRPDQLADHRPAGVGAHRHPGAGRLFRLRHPGRVRIVGADAAHRHAHVHLRRRGDAGGGDPDRQGAGSRRCPGAAAGGAGHQRHHHRHHCPPAGPAGSGAAPDRRHRQRLAAGAVDQLRLHLFCGGPHGHRRPGRRKRLVAD